MCCFVDPSHQVCCKSDCYTTAHCDTASSNDCVSAPIECAMGKHWHICIGAILVLRNAFFFFWKLDPHPSPRNANNIEPYTCVMLFSRKSAPPPPPHKHLKGPICANFSRVLVFYFFGILTSIVQSLITCHWVSVISHAETLQKIWWISSGFCILFIGRYQIAYFLFRKKCMFKSIRLILHKTFDRHDGLSTKDDEMDDIVHQSVPLLCCLWRPVALRSILNCILNLIRVLPPRCCRLFKFKT